MCTGLERAEHHTKGTCIILSLCNGILESYIMVVNIIDWLEDVNVIFSALYIVVKIIKIYTHTVILLPLYNNCHCLWLLLTTSFTASVKERHS